MSDDDDEEDIIYHGTTLQIANEMLASRRLGERETYFARTRDLAFHFADRTCAKQARAGVPAILQIGLYRSDLKNWTLSRLVRSKGFDEGDAGELRGKTQLIFSAEGIRLLNTYSFKDSWQVEVRDKK